MTLFLYSFGHDVLTSCSYCRSFNDYALYALPSALLEYVREIGFIGVCLHSLYLLFLDSNRFVFQALTLPTSPREHLRPLGLGTLIAFLMVEVYNTLTIQFAIPPPGDDSKMTMVKI